jgi:hypothetical protein
VVRLEAGALVNDVRGVPAGTHVTTVEVLEIGYLVEAFDDVVTRSTSSSPARTTSATANHSPLKSTSCGTLFREGMSGATVPRAPTVAPAQPSEN